MNAPRDIKRDRSEFDSIETASSNARRLSLAGWVKRWKDRARFSLLFRGSAMEQPRADELRDEISATDYLRSQVDQARNTLLNVPQATTAAGPIPNPGISIPKVEISPH
jgi:hypothetical protein